MGLAERECFIWLKSKKPVLPTCVDSKPSLFYNQQPLSSNNVLMRGGNALEQITIAAVGDLLMKSEIIDSAKTRRRIFV